MIPEKRMVRKLNIRNELAQVRSVAERAQDQIDKLNNAIVSVTSKEKSPKFTIKPVQSASTDQINFLIGSKRKDRMIEK